MINYSKSSMELKKKTIIFSLLYAAYSKNIQVFGPTTCLEGHNTSAGGISRVSMPFVMSQRNSDFQKCCV